MAMVLVVDDTAVDRRLAGGILESLPDLEVCYANNGKEALLQLGSFVPDLVVTDLQMPDLDGLELVVAMGEQFPEVPVVLMTAHGSENIAAQALASGAASFVPKSDLADNLLQTVTHVLMVADSNARYKKLARCATKTVFEFEIDNDLSIVAPLIDMIQQVTLSQKIFSSSTHVQVGVALEQALHNAIVRGNLEIGRDEIAVISNTFVDQRANKPQYRDRSVYFKAVITPHAVEFTVRDQGPGFNVSTVPEAAAPENFGEGMGRGLVLIKTFMDEVTFNESGNELKMIKFRNHQ